MIDFVSWEDPVIGFHVEPFNWRLRKARQARGWTRSDLARQAGVDPGAVGNVEKLRHVSAAVREKLALLLEIPEDILFPGVIDDLPKSGPGTIEIPFTEEQVGRWIEAGTPDALDVLMGDIENGDLREDLNVALATLKPRVQTVLRRRFGLDGAPRTHEEIGSELGVSRARIAQLEAEGMRCLRCSTRTHPLRYHVDRRLDGPSLRVSG